MLPLPKLHVIACDVNQVTRKHLQSISFRDSKSHQQSAGESFAHTCAHESRHNSPHASSRQLFATMLKHKDREQTYKRTEHNRRLLRKNPTEGEAPPFSTARHVTSSHVKSRQVRLGKRGCKPITYHPHLHP